MKTFTASCFCFIVLLVINLPHGGVAQPSWQKPDFFLAAITLDPQPVETGATFSATVTVRNDGHIAGDAGILRLWLSQSDLVAEGMAGDYEIAAGVIAAGETVTFTFPGLSAPASSGTYHVRAMIDADGQTAEYSIGNNQLPRAYTVFGPATGGGDGAEEPTGGDLWGWGLNPGRVILPDLPSPGPIWSPVTVAADKEWRIVRAGGSHITAVCSEGKLWGWGYNKFGQTGIGATNPMHISFPQEIGDGAKWKTIATGSDNHSLAILEDGTLWAWGDNTNGQIGVGLSSESVPAPQQIGTVSDWLQVAGGHYHSVALRQDGTIWTWGRGSAGALGHGEVTDELLPRKVGGEDDWVSVAASFDRTLALKSDGSLWIWGAGVSGLPSQVNQPTRFGDDSDWKMVAPGHWHTLAQKEDGSLWVWGLNRYGEFGTGIQSEWRTNIPIQVGTRTDWRSVAASGHVSFAISAEGELWAWGAGNWGRTGLGGGNDALVPTQVGEFSDWIDVSPGWSFTLGLRGILPTNTDNPVGASWQKPDFFLAAIALDPQPVETGATFSATVTVRNDGHIAGDAGILRLWLSQSDAVAEGMAGDYEIAAGTIAAGQTLTFTFPGLSAPASSGTYHVRAMIDADGQTAEYSIGNNQLPRAYTVFAPAAGDGDPADGGNPDVQPWQKPDFFLAAIALDPHPVEARATFTATVTVRNDGHIAGDAGILRLWINQRDAVTEGMAGDCEIAAGVIAAGETVTFTFPGLSAPASSGTYHVRAMIDADGQTAEYSIGNNQLPRAYTVVAAPGTEIPSWMKPDFVIQSIHLTPQPTTVGARFDAILRVTNIGDIPGDANDLAVWTRSPSWSNLTHTPDEVISLGSLAVGEVVEIVLENLHAPSDRGTYFVRAVVNPSGLTPEKSAGNNHGGATYTVHPLVLRIKLVPGVGNHLSWQGNPGFEYWVERSTTLVDGFSIIAGPLPGIAPETVYLDDSPPSGGMVFYRVWGTQR